MTESKTTDVLPLRITIVGAGLAGLSAAISCALAGHHVLVTESAKELAEVCIASKATIRFLPMLTEPQVGAGLQITPNASKLFAQWGILEALEPKAAEPSCLAVRRYSDGKILSKTKNFDVEMRRKYDAPFWDLHRVDLQVALYERAKQLGVEVRLGARVADVDFDAPLLRLENGEELKSDLIVAADGLWSKCRERFLAAKGTADQPLPTGDLAYRIVLRLEDLEDDRELYDWVANPTCNFWIGPESHVVAYSLRGGQMFNIVLLVPDNLPAGVSKQAGSVGEMRAIFEGWDLVLNRFLDHVKTVDKWKLMHRPELDSWVSDKSNFVFIGDSAHSMLPYLAQGANSSLEDGAVLGYVLAALRSKEQLPQALEMFQQLRKKRGEAIVRETFAQRNDFHMINGAEQEARDELMLSVLGKEINVKFPSRWQCPVVQPWLYGYDAKTETEAALRERPFH
jgi:salicylate hydroxylase